MNDKSNNFHFSFFFKQTFLQRNEQSEFLITDITGFWIYFVVTKVIMLNVWPVLFDGFKRRRLTQPEHAAKSQKSVL